LGGPGGGGSGRDAPSCGDAGGRGALLRDDEGGCGGGIGKPLLVPLTRKSADRDGRGSTGGRGGPPPRPSYLLGPLQVSWLSLPLSAAPEFLDSHLLICGGGAGGCTVPFTFRPTQLQGINRR